MVQSWKTQEAVLHDGAQHHTLLMAPCPPNRVFKEDRNIALPWPHVQQKGSLKPCPKLAPDTQQAAWKNENTQKFIAFVWALGMWLFGRRCPKSPLGPRSILRIVESHIKDRERPLYRDCIMVSIEVFIKVC